MVELMGQRKTLELNVHDGDAYLHAFVGWQTDDRPTGQPTIPGRAATLLTNAIKNDVRFGFVARNAAEVAVTPASNAQTRQLRALTVDEWRQLAR